MFASIFNKPWKIILALGLCLTITSQIPILNIPVIILTIPLFYAFPHALGQTGTLVQWWFLGFIPQDDLAWLVFWIYYTIIAWALYTIVRWLKSH